MADTQQTAEHKDPNYIGIFVLLVIALAGSLGLGYLAPSTWSVFLIFAVAAIKAYLVLAYFIHLEREPHFVKILVVGLIIVLAVLYVTLIPDIIWVYGGKESPV